MSQAELSVTGDASSRKMGSYITRFGRLVEPGTVPRHGVMGTEVEVLLGGADTADRFALCRITARPGDGVPMHRHIREDETFIVVEGRLRVVVGDHDAVIGPGTVACLPQDQSHGWWVAGDEPATFYVLGTPAGLDRFFPELALAAAGTPPPMDQVIVTSLRYGIVFDEA